MNRRPWPILFLALLQFLSTFIYIAVAANFYGTTIPDTMREILSLASDLRKFEIFVLPMFLGLIILITKRIGYFIVIFGSVYLIVRSVMEFLATNQTDPIFPVVISNVICAIVLAYFVRTKTREVYFNPKIRWWETDPRYVVNLTGTLTRVGMPPENVSIENIAVGGAGVNTMSIGYLREEMVDFAFRYGNETITLKSRIIWQRSTDQKKSFLGLQWSTRSAGAEHKKLRKMIHDLHAKKTPRTRRVPPWWEDLKTWVAGGSRH